MPASHCWPVGRIPQAVRTAAAGRQAHCDALPDVQVHTGKLEAPCWRRRQRWWVA